MLRGLHIRDILIIDRLEIAFQPGLNVLTGETGAGKSILLDALGFVLGWRGRSDLVRSGAPRGEVTAAFEVGAEHPVQAVLDDAGFERTDELILRRTNTPDGRKTAYVNDSRVSGEVLRRLSACLVELHGQHDDRGLLDPKGHRALLDGVAGRPDLLAATRQAWSALAAARKAEREAQQAVEAARAEEDFLRHAVDELDALAPEPGEAERLDERRRMMQGAERVRADIARAADILGGDEGAEDRAAAALRWLEGATELLGDRVAAPMAAIERALAELGDATSGVQDCLDALDFDAAELEATEERLFAIRALARKHQLTPDALPDLAGELRARLDRIERGADNLDRLARERQAAEAAYDEATAALTEARREAAARLDAAMQAELAPLKMDRAVFTTELGEATPGPEGRDAVAFRVATNPGAAPGPLERIASGGELSRFLLALKVCVTAGAEGITLIFDEIDRGVGGATADAVGRRLAALAGQQAGQVLVVTHSPQVAALGHHHWRVEKQTGADSVRSTIRALDAGDRVDEIARMLSGDRLTEEARQAARALLAG